eukprot:s129_g18.t1
MRDYFGSPPAGLLLDKDGCEVSSFGTSLPMFTFTTEPIREVLILLGGPRGIESEELVRLIDIFSGAGTWTGPGFTQGLMKIRLPGGLHHSCVALNDLLSFHDKGYLIPVVEDYKGLGEDGHRAKSAAMNLAITAWATSSLPAKSKCEALQRFAWKVQHSCLDGADSSSNQRLAVVAEDEELATPNEVSSYLDKLQASGQFPRDTPWRSQWRLTMCLEAIEPARALKVLRECHRRSLEAARCGKEFHPWEELAFDLDEALRSAPSKKDHCPRDVRSALLKARQEHEVAEEEDLFPDADMMQLLGELPCEQAAQLLQNCCSNPQESMLYLSHSIANAIMRYQGGWEADSQLRIAIKAFLNSAEYEGRDEEAYERLKQTCHKPRRQRWWQPPEQLALGDVPRTVPELPAGGELPGGSDAETKPPKVIRPPFRAKAPAAAKAGAKAAAKATSKATAKAAAKSSATAQAKTQAKAQAKTQAKAQAKTQAKTPSKLAKAQPKASAKAETKRKLPLPKKLQQPPPPKRSIWLPRLQNQEESKGREVKIVVVVPANALERNEDIGGPEDQIIALSSLPEPVATRYYRMKRKMEKIRDAALDRLEDEDCPLADLRRQKLIEAGIGLEQIENTRRSGRRSSQLALADGEDDVPHQDDEDVHSETDDRIPTSSEMATIIVNRVQLQRMLDEDPRLAEICSSDKAVDVVRRFRVDQTGHDPFEVVARLQASVAEKLNAIESIGTDLAFDEVETLRVMSQELHSALTESQKEWRAELLSVLQLASLLSNALIDLTKKIEQVQLNHTELAIRDRLRRFVLSQKTLCCMAALSRISFASALNKKGTWHLESQQVLAVTVLQGSLTREGTVPAVTSWRVSMSPAPETIGSEDSTQEDGASTTELGCLVSEGPTPETRAVPRPRCSCREAVGVTLPAILATLLFLPFIIGSAVGAHGLLGARGSGPMCLLALVWASVASLCLAGACITGKRALASLLLLGALFCCFVLLSLPALRVLLSSKYLADEGVGSAAQL